MRRALHVALTLLLTCAAGCPSDAPPAAPPAATATAPAPAPTKAPEGPVDRELPVKCGCVVEGVKKCGEWADLDGQWVELTGNHGLGSMPFCGKQGLRARVTGHVEKDGKLHLTKLALVP